MSTKKRAAAAEPEAMVKEPEVKKRKTSLQGSGNESQIVRISQDNTDTNNNKQVPSGDRVALTDISNSSAPSDLSQGEKSLETPAATSVPTSAQTVCATGRVGNGQLSIEQIILQDTWQSGHVTLSCRMGMSGPLRSLHGLRSVEAAHEEVKEWPDKGQIRGCPVFIMKQDPTTKFVSEELVGFVVPSRGGKRPSGAKLDVIPGAERAAMEAHWKALVERDQM